VRRLSTFTPRPQLGVALRSTVEGDKEMAKFRIRYVVGQGPEGSEDVLEVDAAMFQTAGDFTDFFSKGEENLSGRLNSSGDVVMRVRNDFVADIRKID
jgi:hypothetical protein